MKSIRLDKFLADAGLGTRSEVKVLLKKRAVTVNGMVCTKPEQKICPDIDQVLFQGQPVSESGFSYYMLNKPAGVISATEDRRDRTVLDILAEGQVSAKDLFPVGRLDKDTEGLLLLTDDGPLAHELLSPKKHVDKTYFVRVDGEITEADEEAFRRGVEIGEGAPTRPAVLKILHAGPVSEAELTIQEGKFHQVKRMFHAVGKEVLYLKRLSMGPLVLDPALAPGEFRPLTAEELTSLNRG